MSRVVVGVAAVAVLLAAGDVASRIALGRSLLSFADRAPAPVDDSPVGVICTNGEVVATGRNGWHVNDVAPWKWTDGSRVSLNRSEATFSGGACRGTLKAFVCNDEFCKGPLALKVE